MTAAAEHDEAPPELTLVDMDQIVAMNIRYWRRAAGMSQDDLGKLLGWSAANVSAAERSADEKRERRRFDASTLTALSLALSVPLIALFLPPEDDGTVKDYLFQAPGGKRDMGDLMALVVMTDSDDDSDVMLAYRRRFRAAADAYLDEEWAKEVGSWLRNLESAEVRAIRAARLRTRQAEALRAAAEWGSLADAIDPEGGSSE